MTPSSRLPAPKMTDETVTPETALSHLQGITATTHAAVDDCYKLLEKLTLPQSRDLESE